MGSESAKSETRSQKRGTAKTINPTHSWLISHRRRSGHSNADFRKGSRRRPSVRISRQKRSQLIAIGQIKLYFFHILAFLWK
jgi:hypothetical protein